MSLKYFFAIIDKLLGNIVVRYAQYIFIFLALSVFDLQITNKAIVLFLLLYLCQFPLAYDLLSLPLMTSAYIINLLREGSLYWFSITYFVYLALEVFKFAPLIYARFYNTRAHEDG